MFKPTKITRKCTCGKEYNVFIYLNDEYDYDPYFYMCPDCNKKENWRLTTRLLKLEKFKCVKCSWKLNEKNSYKFDENVLYFHCPCCGYNFGLYFEYPY